MNKITRIVVLLCSLFAGVSPNWAAIIINEIHYNPDVKTEPAEFVELFNAGTNNVNLAGWTLSLGGNVSFTFPATNVAPGGYAVAAQNPAFLQTKFTVTGVLGPFTTNATSALSRTGDKLTLRNAGGQVEDEVEYQLGFPWPTVGDALVVGKGSSMELINPGLDNNLGGSWRSSISGAVQTNNTTLLASSSTWKYLKGTNEASSPTTSWRQQGFNDAAWSSGPLPIGYGETFTNTLLEDMNGNYTCVFLRKQFTVANPAQFNQLLIQAQYDDGFKAWINGVLVIDGSANMAPGEVPFTGTAIAAIENTNYVTFVLAQNPASVLVAGANTLAVQAHNSSLTGSSDFFFDARVIGQTGAGGSGPTPGRINTVFANNAPPQIRQVEHSPKQPVAGTAVTITAKVTDPDGVGSVTLEYQMVNPGSYIELTDTAYTNAANWVTVAMNDAGTGGDVAAGDDVFTAVLPAAVQAHRRLIRYRITVADTANRAVRVPYADDPQPNFAYFCWDGAPAWTGAVQPGTGGANGVAFTVPAAEMNRLPVYQLITKSNEFAEAIGWAPGLPNNRYGGDSYLWTGTLVVDGEVYDHIGFRCRGGVWRYSMGKNAMKFSLNRGHDLEVKDNWGRKLKSRWRRLSFRANIQQGDFLHRGEQGLFESVGYRLYELTGAYGLKNVQLQFRVVDDAREVVAGNQYQGDFYGLWLAVEEEDGRFLEERDLPDGNVYDMEGGTGTLNHTGAGGPVNKSDLNYLLTYGSPTPTEAWWRTNLDLRSYYSYQAISQGIHQYDIADGKNYFYYKNPVSGLWQVWPWDLDLTWADNMYRGGQQGGDEPFKSRVLNNFASPGTFQVISTEFRNRVREIRDLLFNTDEAFKLIDEYWWMTRGTNSFSIVDADRALWDYNPVMFDANIVNLSKAGNYHFYQWQNEPGTSNNFSGAAQMMKNYIRYRSTNITFSLDTMSVDNAKPARPAITYTGPANYPINRLTFHSTTYNGANPFGSVRWRVGEITDTNIPFFNPEDARKYEIEAVWESGPITAFNPDIQLPANLLRVGSRYRARVLHTDITGRNSQWSLPQEFVVGPSDNLADLQNYLRVTEVMFNPPAGGFEFIELYNSSGSVTLDLAGVKFTQGVDFTFPLGATLAPGAFLLVVGTADVTGFRAYYGLDGSVAIYGPYTGSLNNAGEQLVLRTSAGGNDIVNFSYGDGRGWPVTADGSGHSMVLLDGAISGQGAGAGEYGGNWRASTYLKGSPGRADAVPPATVLLNEIVAHTDFLNELDSNDWIELYNPTASPITLGPGWYLSDDGSAYTNLMKWAIPPLTIIPAHGWVSFDEQTGFHNPTNIGFGLNKAGEQVFLSYLPGNAQDRVVDAVSFKGQENDWSLGRYPDGGPFWSALTPRTRDAANTAPPARVVISELLYHPPDVLVGTNATDNLLDEFIEIQNGSVSAVTLHNTNGTWRLNGGVDFTFPTNLTLAANEYLVVVNFNPATNAAQSNAFRSLYGITDASLRILGPYLGKLANNSDRIALERPQHPDATNDTVNWVIVDEVLYADQSPWPCGSDGTGNSLQRLNAVQHGSDPAAWAAEPPTAGRPRANLPAGLPAITSPPQNRVAPTNGVASFSVSVCGTPPFTYQWQFNSGNITNATNATLNLANLTLGQAGNYRVIVSNPAGSITSQVAVLVVQSPPFITAQPQPATTIRDQSASFTVTAGGTPPISYQWRFNGVDLLGATNNMLLLTNVQASQAGNYSVLVANTASSIVSSNALLTVLIPPSITQQPQSTNVQPGTNVTLTVLASGTGTMRYQWRLDGTNIPGATNFSYSFTNAQLYPHAGLYTVQVSNNVSGVLSQPAALIVMVRPGITNNPAPQTVYQGGTAVFTVSAGPSHPLLPLYYRWLRNGSLWASNTFPDLVIANCQSNGTFRVTVGNLAGTANSVPSGGVPLTVLTDFDHDGMADNWELSYPGFSTNNAADALLDFDGDGMINRDEFLAGTNPLDALSLLKIVLSATNANTLHFVAQTNLGYTVQWRNNLSAGSWLNLSNIAAQSQVRTVELNVPKPLPEPQRFYRIVTPIVP